MDKIKEAINNLYGKKLDKMRENFNAALSQKAVQKLEERKTNIANAYIKAK